MCIISVILGIAWLAEKVRWLASVQNQPAGLSCVEFVAETANTNAKERIIFQLLGFFLDDKSKVCETFIELARRARARREIVIRPNDRQSFNLITQVIETLRRSINENDDELTDLL